MLKGVRQGGPWKKAPEAGKVESKSQRGPLNLVGLSLLRELPKPSPTAPDGKAAKISFVDSPGKRKTRLDSANKREEKRVHIQQEWAVERKCPS